MSDAPNLKTCEGTVREPHAWILYQQNPHEPGCPWCRELRRHEERERRRGEMIAMMGNTL